MPAKYCHLVNVVEIRLLDSFPAREREVLRRHCIGGEPLRQIAAEWHLSPRRLTAIHAAAAHRFASLALKSYRRALIAER